MPAEPSDYVSTRIGQTTPDTITVAGRDLPSEIMGRLSLTELAYVLLTDREPTAGERRVLDACLVSLADHGLTPSAMAARLTHTGAPEAIQASVAAGLLGAGSVFLGPTGDTAEVLHAAIAEFGPGDLDHCAIHIVDRCIDAGRRVPGLGHPIHRVEDPRTPRLYAIAEEEGLLGPHLDLLRRVAAIHEAATGKRLPINGAGAAGAALVDVGVPPSVVRGFVLIARTAGLVAHLLEESQQPLGLPLWMELDERASRSGTAEPHR